MEYLILTTRHKDMLFGGDVYLFWGPNKSGYTAILQRAGLYTKEEAYKIGNEEDIPINISKIGLDRSVFEQKTDGIIQTPILFSKTEYAKNLIDDWKYEYRRRNKNTVTSS
jgi:hypothetical protein